MRIDISQETEVSLDQYARVPIAFQVSEVFDVADQCSGAGGWVLLGRRLEVPYLKDYDVSSQGGPAQWAERFDVSNWGLFFARLGGQRVGGAAIGLNTKSLIALDDREDLAVLWDIRVSPEVQGKGVGSMLFQAASTWARAKGCRQLAVETQNINVPACRFYARHGFVLGAVQRSAYAGFPDEVQLLWYKEIVSGS